MKTTILTILLLFSGILIAQNDTLIVANNYKFKIGVKGLFEKSGIPKLTPETNSVYNFGLQGIYKLGKLKSSIESGIYYYSRKGYATYIDTIYSTYPKSYLYSVSYRNIHIPLKYRLDTKSIYFSIGVYGEYLIGIDDDEMGIYYDQKPADRKFNIGYTGALGIEKNISKQFSIFVEGEFSINLTSTKNEFTFFYFNDSYAINYTNYGFSFGVAYKILNQ